MNSIRRWVWMIAGCLLSLTVAAQQYSNPVLHLDYSDPDVCRVGEDYYLTASSFHYMPGLPILHSRDLVHWQLIAYALTDYPSVGHGEGVWAPSIRYHDGWFYIFCGDPDRGIFMVRSREPQGPWSAPVWVVEARGFIDPCPFWDADGSAWLVHGCAGSRAGLKSVLFLAPLNEDATAVTGPSRIIYDGHLTQPTIEGPKVYKRGDWYYIFAPAGGVATGWQTVLRSRSLQGPYEEKIVMAWAPGSVNGPHQGGWVETPYGEDWFLHFQDKGAYGRIVHLQPLSWQADGWPLIGEDPDGDGVGQPVARWRMPRAEAGAVPAGYSPLGLPLAWQFQGPVSPYWYYSLPDDGVRLYAVQQAAESIMDCPNLLSQKFPAESFTVEARLSFSPNPRMHGERAGFAVTGSRYAALEMLDSEEGVLLRYLWGGDAPEASQPIVLVPRTEWSVDHSRESQNVPRVSYPSGRKAVVFVRLEVRPVPREGQVPEPRCQFSYSLDGRKWKKISSTFTAAPEHWTGSRFAFYCTRPLSRNDTGWLDVEDLKVF